MARETDTRKCKNFRVEESLHNALIEIVNMTGKSMEDLFVDGANKVVTEFAKHSKGKNVQAHDAQLKLRERQTQQTILKQVAAAYQNEPTEEALDEFQALCDVLETSIEKVIDEMKEMPHITEVLKGANSISNAEMWILQNVKPGKPVASTTVEATGFKVGYRKWTLRDAKDRLNQSGSVKIDIMKQGTKWFWVMTMPNSNGSVQYDTIQDESQ